MGRDDTGLSDNSPNENEVSLNRELEHPVPDEDSDSEFDPTEEDRSGHYMPLSQNPNEGEPFYGSSNESDDEGHSQENDIAGATEFSNLPLPQDVLDFETHIVEEVWLKPVPKEVDIELTDQKIDLVKEAMLNIQLPSEAIPEWAKNIPEEDWKNHLMERIQNRSN